MTPERLGEITDRISAHLGLTLQQLACVLAIDLHDLRRCLHGTRFVPARRAEWLERVDAFLADHPTPGHAKQLETGARR